MPAPNLPLQTLKIPDATPLKAQFIEHEMPADFLEDLKKHIDLLTPKGSEGESPIVSRRADEQQVVVLPGWQVRITAPPGHQSSKDLAQHGSIDVWLSELYEEDSPGRV